MESYGDTATGGGFRADDSADSANRSTRPAEEDADARTAPHAGGCSETTTLAEPAVVAVGSFPSSLLAPVPSAFAARPPSSEPVERHADVPSAPTTKSVANVRDEDGPPDDPTRSKPPNASGLDASLIVSPVGECRICLGTAAEGGGEMCAPCACEGSVRLVHVACLERWCRETGVVSCELCTVAFPARFAAVGASVRASRRARERRAAEEHAMARERLARLLENFAAAYGRPARGPADFAVINLNAVLEAEARARRRTERFRARGARETVTDVSGISRPAVASAATRTETATAGSRAPRADDAATDDDALLGDEHESTLLGDDDDGTRVTVIDARGRAVTLDTARVGAGRLARAMLAGEEAPDATDDFFEADETAAYDAYGAYPPGSRLGRARRAGRLARGRAAMLARGDEERDAASVGPTRFRVWLKAASATLCFFLALYLVLFVVAASAPASGAHVFSLRAFGVALPLLLLARVAYLYRRQRVHAVAAPLDEVFVIGDFEAARDFEAAVDAEAGAPRVPGRDAGEEIFTPAAGVQTAGARREREENEMATAERRARSHQ